jgi:putative effector of murein hydrolase LrgA (UPF0299 family)
MQRYLVILLLAVFKGIDCFSITSSNIRPASKYSFPFISSEYKPNPIHNVHQRSRHSRTLLASTNIKQEPFSSNIVSTLQVLASTSAIMALDTLFRKLFHAMSIQFPSSLAGCTALFAFLILLHSMKKEWGDFVFSLLNPGATLFAKWLPVFFVPSLVTLPLAPSLGSTQEVGTDNVFFSQSLHYTIV